MRAPAHPGCAPLIWEIPVFWNLLIGLFYLVDAGIVFGLSLLFVLSTRTRRSR